MTTSVPDECGEIRFVYFENKVYNDKGEMMHDLRLPEILPIINLSCIDYIYN